MFIRAASVLDALRRTGVEELMESAVRGMSGRVVVTGVMVACAVRAPLKVAGVVTL